MSKFSAVLLTNSGNCGQSLSNSDVIFTLGIMFVLTPVTKWHLTHLLDEISLPCLKLYHLWNIEVPNPVLSMAKSCSIVLNGNEVIVTIWDSKGINSFFLK